MKKSVRICKTRKWPVLDFDDHGHCVCYFCDFHIQEQPSRATSCAWILLREMHEKPGKDEDKSRRRYKEALQEAQIAVADARFRMKRLALALEQFEVC